MRQGMYEMDQVPCAEREVMRGFEYYGPNEVACLDGINISRFISLFGKLYRSS